MSHILITRAPDGRHVRTFKTEAAALGALAGELGRKVDQLVAGLAYYDDWGRRLVVEARPAGHTAAREAALAAAYDARETGVATARQLALLDKHGF